MICLLGGGVVVALGAGVALTRMVRDYCACRFFLT
jgi:hypothetical protein